MPHALTPSPPQKKKNEKKNNIDPPALIVPNFSLSIEYVFNTLQIHEKINKIMVNANVTFTCLQLPDYILLDLSDELSTRFV